MRGTIERVCLALLFALGTLQIAAQHKPVVIAHRGNHRHAPENTLRAFQNAINAGVDYVEVDLRTTRDGVLVVMHDETIDRMTSSQGKIKELDWNSLKDLQVIDKKHPEKGQDRIPTFREVLEICKGKVKIYLDFKEASVAATMKIVNELRMEDQIVVYVNSIEQYQSWREVAPRTPIIASLPSYQLNDALNFLSKYPVEILDGRNTLYSHELVAAAHKSNLLIWVDVQQPVENNSIWESALIMQFDGLQTDHPEELIAYLKQRALR